MPDMPATIAGFRVVRELGKGGAASVIYEVVDAQQNRFALKQTVKRGDQDQRFLDQAINEHHVANKVDSPLLRKSHQMLRRGLLKTTEVLLVMELVEGEPLEKSPQSDMRKLIRILDQTAEGLDVMHKAGLVHSDINPKNILLLAGTPGGRSRVKLIDFGHSCPIGTVKKRIQGTPQYIAPEQVHCGPITVYTDVYNLGATMYASVTGQTVEPPPGLTRARDRSPPPTPRHPGELRAECPPTLGTLIMDCLRPRPRDRPSSMETVRQRLVQAYRQLSGPYGATPPPLPNPDATRPAERRAG